MTAVRDSARTGALVTPRASPDTLPAPMRQRFLPCAFAALLAFGCGEELPRGRWNVLVVLVDTLRADRLGAYGYDRPTSPHLDALAAGSYLFTDSRAQAPCTYPSAKRAMRSKAPPLAPPTRTSGPPG